jgi:acetyl-CoA acetyltransferase
MTLAALSGRSSTVRGSTPPASGRHLGCANQAGEDNRDVARMAVLLAGLPVEVGA